MGRTRWTAQRQPTIWRRSTAQPRSPPGWSAAMSYRTQSPSLRSSRPSGTAQAYGIGMNFSCKIAGRWRMPPLDKPFIGSACWVGLKAATLVLDNNNELNTLAQSLLAEAGQANWKTDPALAMKVVGWSKNRRRIAGIENHPSASKKPGTGVGQWPSPLWLFLVILDWMSETDHYAKKARAQVTIYEDED